MRTVLSSDEIAAVWIKQTQPHARCSSHMSFEGRKFYSYGTVVAEIVTYRGKTAFLVNSWSYSHTTSRHVNRIRYAIPKGVPHFEVPGVGINDRRSFGDLKRIMSAWQKNIEYILHESKEAREPKQTRLLIDAYHSTLRLRAFGAFFGLSLRKYDVALPFSEQKIKALIRERAQYEKEARHERAERARLAIAVRRLSPDEKISTRKVHAMYAAAKRERLT
ncbi:MAG: hypothetical protein WB439_04760 [Acidobacteriaceae bacterium]